MTLFQNREIKSRWNCGSITCIICLTCVGSQLSINSSSASSFSGPVQLWNRGCDPVYVLAKNIHTQTTIMSPYVGFYILGFVQIKQTQYNRSFCKL
uniref:Uncharacterized protein n=1 Tax=Monopterus albus TaxID=43700 RepID=A0A3Q3IVT4_MONAL